MSLLPIRSAEYIAAFKVKTKVTGVVPLYLIASLYVVDSAAVVWVPLVDAIHPSGPASSVEFIKVVDPVHIAAAAHAASIGHMDLVFAADSSEHVEDCLSVFYLNGSYRQYDAAGRYYSCPFAFEVHTVVYGCIAAYGYGNGLSGSTGTASTLVIIISGTSRSPCALGITRLIAASLEGVGNIPCLR